MYTHILPLLPAALKSSGITTNFMNKQYRITSTYSHDGGITKLYIKMKNPAWAEAHLMTCGYSRTNHKIFQTILNNRMGEKQTVIPPALPYLVSNVEPGIIMDKECLTWLSPFARCIAWAALDPQNYMLFMKQ
jgi:hypothetical protein